MSYLVAPTQQDQENSYKYAMNKLAKEVCELPQFQGKYEWKEDPIVPYPCPYGLKCNSGRCIFTEKGCKASSSLPFFDCKRTNVECYLPNNPYPDGQCGICDFTIQNKEVTGPFIDDAYSYLPGSTPSQSVLAGACAPGDNMYLRMTNPEDDVSPDYDTTHYRCQGMIFNPDPYEMRSEVPLGDNASCAAACEAYVYQTVPTCKLNPDKPDVDEFGNCSCKCTVDCEADDDCGAYGAGGSCMLYEYLWDEKTHAFSTTEKTKAYKKCVDSGAPYLEYRKNFTLWTDAEKGDQCVQSTPYFRKWCEMPWSRSGSSEDDMSQSILERINKHPQVKRHPPFFYDGFSGQCFMNKKYCTNSIPDGGFDTNFGDPQSYLMGVFTDCKNPSHNSAIVRDGYDCCIPLGMSIAAFFTGRSLLTSVQDVISGEITFEQFWKDFGGPLTPVVDGWLSEDSLKIHKRIVAQDMIAPGVSVWEFEWSARARALYPHMNFSHGPRYGLMASEMERAVPDQMGHTQLGHRKLVIDPVAWERNPTYRRIAKALAVLELAALMGVDKDGNLRTNGNG